MSILKCSGVALGYDGKIIMKDLSFEVGDGEYVAIVGENGSGKSTLMRTLLGLQSKICGTIEYSDGLKTTDIGYLPQQSEHQKDFPASVSEVALSGAQGKMGWRPFYNRKEKAHALELMKELEIEDIAKRSFAELSGGQRQRVLLARAMMATGKILLLDEPVAGLDPKATAEMYHMIDKLNKDGITIIMISHDISAAVRYASHILHIGRHIFFGTTEEYLASDIGRIYTECSSEVTHKMHAGFTEHDAMCHCGTCREHEKEAHHEHN